VWAAVALVAAGGLFAARRARGPETGGYRLEPIDRGAIRNEVMAPGTVSAVAVPQDRGAHEASSRAQVEVTVSEPDVARVLVEADNRDQKLRPGMKATVVIEVARRDGVLRLPLPALSFAPPGMEPTARAAPHVGCVFVLDHGRPRPVRVTVGLRDGLHAELVAGPLREGDAVIVGDPRGLRPD
jgi:multidrug efflux pump subunit AcrA (membrane-fusion protein)